MGESSKICPECWAKRRWEVKLEWYSKKILRKLFGNKKILVCPECHSKFIQMSEVYLNEIRGWGKNKNIILELSSVPQGLIKIISP